MKKVTSSKNSIFNNFTIIVSVKNIIWLILFFIFSVQLSCWLGIPTEGQLVIPPIKDICFTNNNEFWLVNGKGEVLQVNSLGQVKQNVKFENRITQIFFINVNEGWVLSEQGFILFTNDGGKSWNKIHQFDSKTATVGGISNQLIFIDSQTGWIVEGLGFWITQDGGNSWKRLLSNEKISISDLRGQPLTYFTVNSKIGWLGMTNGKILKTNDSGQTWDNVSLPQQSYNSVSERKPNEEVSSLFCFDEKSCWAAIGSRGGLLLTTNGGKDWQAVLENKVKPNTAINSINFVTEKIGWAVGIEFILNTNETPNNVVLKTIDGGKTWNHINTEIDEPYFTKVKFIDEQNGWLVGKKTIYKTGDGGNSWRKIYQVE